jgi:hypothetical protein
VPRAARQNVDLLIISHILGREASDKPPMGTSVEDQRSAIDVPGAARFNPATTT